MFHGGSCADFARIEGRTTGMDLRQLRYFVAVVDAGSLSKAAHQVYIAQPALSQQMAGLEDELNARLLVRSSQGVRPTESGKVLYKHARTVLRQIEEAKLEVRRPYRGEAGLVVLGLPQTISALLTVPLMSKLRERHSGIYLHLFESLGGYLAELLAQERLDLCMLLREVETPGIGLQRLVDEDLFLIGGPKTRKTRDVVKLPDLHGLPLVLPSKSQGGLRTMIERIFARDDIELNVVADVDSFPSLLALAQSGFAYTILPSSALPAGVARPCAVRRLIEPSIHRTVSLCWTTSSPRTAAALAVQRIVVEVVEELVTTGRWAGVRLRTRDEVAPASPV